MPTEDDVQRLLRAVQEFYDPARNFSSAKGHSASNRSFHRERTYTVELTKLDSACRIGEIFNLTCSDYEPTTQQLTIRTSKGREPRVLPVSDTLAAALKGWLKVRSRVMRDVPPSEDEGWLFISEAGTRVNEGNYLRGIKKIIRWAGLPEGINNHSQRRFSLNRSAKKGGLLYAQGLAGHKDPKTTMVYLKIDGDYMRDTHRQVNVLGELLGSKKVQKKKRLV